MVIILTGASSGIGKITATYLASKGHTVYGLSRHVVSDVNFSSMVCDMTDFEQVAKVFKEIFEKEKRVDVLINNAGMGIAGAVENTSVEDIDKQFDINLFAVINSCKTIIPFMRNCGGGKIVNIGSVASVIPIPFQTFYATSKCAVDMFSMSLGLEVKDFNIKVCCVLPGDTKTGFTASRVKSVVLEDEHYHNRATKSIEKMEKDEQKGMPAISVAKVIDKVINKKNPPSRKTVGFAYKLIVFLSKILPRRLMLKVIKKMYG